MPAWLGPLLIGVLIGLGAHPARDLVRDLKERRRQARLRRLLANKPPVRRIGGAAIQDSLAVARRGGGIAVASNFVTEEDQLYRLASAREWAACVKGTSDVRGWLDRFAFPTNLWEELALEIWKGHPATNTTSFSGYEYWCSISSKGDNPHWHVDREDGTTELPIMGAYYYGYPHRFQGGYLEVLPIAPPANPRTYYGDTTTKSASDDVYGRVERIEAQYNRLVWLNVSQWHRVSPIVSGTRFALGVNVWKERPASTLPKQHDREEP